MEQIWQVLCEHQLSQGRTQGCNEDRPATALELAQQLVSRVPGTVGAGNGAVGAPLDEGLGSGILPVRVAALEQEVQQLQQERAALLDHIMATGSLRDELAQDAASAQPHSRARSPSVEQLAAAHASMSIGTQTEGTGEPVSHDVALGPAKRTCEAGQSASVGSQQSSSGAPDASGGDEVPEQQQLPSEENQKSEQAVQHAYHALLQMQSDIHGLRQPLRELIGRPPVQDASLGDEHDRADTSGPPKLEKILTEVAGTDGGLESVRIAGLLRQLQVRSH